MKSKKMLNNQKNKNAGMRISIAVHLVLLILAMIPLISAGTSHKEAQVMIIPVDFRAAEGHPEKSLQARAMKQQPVVQPVAEKKENIEKPAENERTEARAEPVTEPDVEYEITSETSEEITASPAEENSMERDVPAASGGVEEAPVTGDMQGSDTAGDDAWKAGLEGDGVLTRRIVHREDITQVAEQDGVIAINVCVNRGGKVSAAKYNEEYTTITDKELIRKALYIVSEYRFETDIAAPAKECGMLTFIFDIDVDREGRMAMID